MIKLLSYGSGNVLAIANIYRTLGISHEIAANESELLGASKIVLPGVGAFDRTMELLDESGMRTALDRLVLEEHVPILGVCVGMQVMANSSEEGSQEGLKWINATVGRIDTSNLQCAPLLPHMGWNSVQTQQPHPILAGIEPEQGFYFLHSYCFHCNDSSNILTTSVYGSEFCSAVVADNIFGFQFHPEKSHQNGIRLFKNFAEL